MRTVKTDRWAIAVNTSSEVVNNLSFNIASSAGATLWGQWSTSSVISRRGPIPGKLLHPIAIDTKEYLFDTHILFYCNRFYCITVTGALHPTGIEGANQTIFVRRIALRPPRSYFGKPSYMHSEEVASPRERFRATFAGN